MAARIGELMPNMLQSTRVARMSALFDQYEAEHGAAALRREPDGVLCTQRKFMVVENVNCESLGNNLGMYLHGIVMALLLNRTVVIAENNHCHQLLQYQQWVPTLAVVEPRLLSRCPNVTFRNPPSPPYACDIDRSTISVITYRSIQNRAFDHFNHLSGARFGPEMQRRRDVLFSCPVFENGRFEVYGLVIDRFLTFGALIQDYVAPDLTAVEEYAQQWSDGATAQVTEEDGDDRPAAGDADGAGEGDAIEIPPKYLEYGERAVPVPFYRIGVHARHRSERTNISAFDAQIEASIVRLLQDLVSHPSPPRGVTPATAAVTSPSGSHPIPTPTPHSDTDPHPDVPTLVPSTAPAPAPARRNNFSCALLIATDRHETLARLSLFARSLHCRPFYATRAIPCQLNNHTSVRPTAHPSTHPTHPTHNTRGDTHPTRSPNPPTLPPTPAPTVHPLHRCSSVGEHGPWASALMTVSDFYFLARGSDYFVGSIESTFSQLIADLVASGNALRAVVRSGSVRGAAAGASGMPGVGGSGNRSFSGSEVDDDLDASDSRSSGEMESSASAGTRGAFFDGIYWVPPQSQGKYYNNLVNANKCTTPET